MTGMTITEKILAIHSGREYVKPGEIIEAKVDLAFANDITAPFAIKVFEELGAKDVFDRNRIVFVPDHFVPNKDIDSANQVKLIRDFAKRYSIRFFELGEAGIEHVLLPEEGLICPGDLVIGADSHTCTYGALSAFSTGVGSTDLGVIMATGKIWLRVPSSIKVIFRGKLRRWVSGKDLILYLLRKISVQGAVYKAIEFSGETVKELSISDRFTMANMSVELGAKNGIFEPDEKLRQYVKERCKREGVYLYSDPDAEYEKIIEIDVDEIEPQIACPHSPDNVRGISEIGEVRIDQVFIGSCTNGRIEDLRIAASILKGKKVAKGVRLIIIPSTPRIFRQALEEGLISIFLDAGGTVGPPCCGPCLGGHMGVLAKGEVAISTTNRNFKGRMGDPESKIYLSNPAVAAASAIAGKIVSPEEVL